MTALKCLLCGRRDHDGKPTLVQEGWLCRKCSEATDRASEDDRLYFEAHPGENVRYRAAFPGEFLGVGTTEPPCPGATLEVEVAQLRPGARTRSPWWALPATEAVL